MYYFILWKNVSRKYTSIAITSVLLSYAVPAFKPKHIQRTIVRKPSEQPPLADDFQMGIALALLTPAIPRGLLDLDGVAGLCVDRQTGTQ